MWIVFDRDVTLRTTNKCENWNMRWNKEVGVIRPNFWNLLKKLSSQEIESRMQLRRISCGEQAPKKRRKYQLLDEKIIRLKSSYLLGLLSSKMYWEGVAVICQNL